ncbi:MAG: KpsF/GutQ family sugar-phosphate isomerase [Candidatus Cloacimonetes bacterium]|jgi:arabinose-5-phosphate isomerase|nr:KpsF/GutQ family sugar-phosphate isomerase [Candidatus Cloacimonadota bacterium]MDY0299135.1 KpsF/GutQ family sugar-phosphate isomerase [Candidatus Cloacimonadaceae bacterium]MCB5278149.1 KpsF/GutQ family sugar-phosphate isomerase [Candidatus Cloacimonadota bacterium]MCK9333179.1 KpsF/GutQ family sugar-phosphate isomerase [Candidatus Cloacimonadota bacterium]MDD2210468.1 KpsF/GutQ family sugar-phosphate isomerase [Candidatus Cloacimonadota bacterium]
MSVFESIKEELLKEASAITSVAETLEPLQVEKAFLLLQKCRGKVVLTGIGKAGIIARKISATLASTGTSSIFLHAGEGIHGDLGMLAKEDLVMAVSNSGNTSEMLAIIPYIKFIGIPLISITGNSSSQLAKASDAVLCTKVDADLEPLGMVPTSSTTVALALGDALAIALLKDKNFSLNDFARFHPGGVIGKKLLLKVADLMHSRENLPHVHENTPMREAILEMTSKKLGCTIIEDDAGLMRGIITDGDLRRQLQIRGDELLTHRAAECMTANPKHALANELAVSALALMEKHSITALPVIDIQGKAIGILHMHDLIRAGVV